VTGLVLFGEFDVSSAAAPDLKAGSLAGTAKESVTLDHSFGGGGVGAYVGPNLFATLALGRLTSTLGDANVQAIARGFGVSAGLGKEWWVGADWGVGVAGNVLWGRVTDVDDLELTAAGYAVSFTATYQ
jgi:hypothetical protein